MVWRNTEVWTSARSGATVYKGIYEEFSLLK